MSEARNCSFGSAVSWEDPSVGAQKPRVGSFCAPCSLLLWLGLRGILRWQRLCWHRMFVIRSTFLGDTSPFLTQGSFFPENHQTHEKHPVFLKERWLKRMGNQPLQWWVWNHDIKVQTAWVGRGTMVEMAIRIWKERWLKRMDKGSTPRTFQGPSLSPGVWVNISSVVQWHQLFFPFFSGGCPTKSGPSPKKGFPFFQGHWTTEPALLSCKPRRREFDAWASRNSGRFLSGRPNGSRVGKLDACWKSELDWPAKQQLYQDCPSLIPC